METKQATVRGRIVQCEYCGENYSVTYKRCPFCDGGRRVPKYAPEVSESSAERRRGGRRVDPKHRGGGGRILAFLISLAIIIAAVWIVVTQAVPFIQARFFEPSSQAGKDSDQTEQAAAPENNDPSTGDTQGVTLSLDKVTLSEEGASRQLKVNFPSGSAETTVQWSSSDSGVVKVSDDGTLTAISVGEATVTGTLDDGTSATCNVVCDWEEADPNITLNKTDFTISKKETAQLKVDGTSKTPVWKVKDSDIATISGDGLVTGVAHGKTEVTAQVGGQTLTCTVRVK